MSTSASDRLLRVRAKIERAKKHIRDLEAFVHAPGGNDLHEIKAELDPQSGDKVHRVYTRPVPVDVGLLIGDAIHNLRSALDHLVWQLVLAAGNEPDRNTAFPIQESAPADETKPSGKVKGVEPAAVRLIDSLKPYQGGSDDLWAIHHLDIIDKHRLLLVAATAMSGIFPGRIVPHWIADATRWSPGLRYPVLEDGAIIHRVPAGAPDHDVDFKLTVEIAFGEPEVVEGKPVLPFLHQMAQLVDCIVNQFIPFL
jgi:hypothetical protein